MSPAEPPSSNGAEVAARGGILTIDLAALSANFRLLKDRVSPAICAAVIKADAYGLGVERVAPALRRAGCDTFFVATLDEGITARRLLPGARILVFHGPMQGEPEAFHRHRLIPVLNDPAQIETWRGFCNSDAGETPPAALHLDSGMNRLGLSHDQVERLAAHPDRLSGIEIGYVMSHLACSEEADNPMNAVQLQRFNDLRGMRGPAKASIANSSGIFLGPAYHLDLIRPGIALYGGNPTPGRPNPMAQVVRLQGKIVQCRRVDTDMTVGYGATHKISGPGRLATVAVGYADGYLRAFSNTGFASVGGITVPIVGRISMDLLTLDVSNVAPELTRPGCLVDLIGGSVSLDAAAAAAGTISYELLTSLGVKSRRVYLSESFSKAVPQ
ncbi:MAG: alanine racemase [Sphingomonadales bacterium]